MTENENLEIKMRYCETVLDSMKEVVNDIQSTHEELQRLPWYKFIKSWQLKTKMNADNTRLSSLNEVFDKIRKGVMPCPTQSKD